MRDSRALPQSLSLDAVRATEAAAVASYRLLGKGDKNAADQVAVDALRASLATSRVHGRVIIGEGEKDNAPMLYNGERVGLKDVDDDGPRVDIAVDPIDGTTQVAAGLPYAISVIAISEGDTMLDMTSVFYSEKLVVGPWARNLVHLDTPITTNLRRMAKASGRRIDELRVAVLDRPRHKRLVSDIHSTGAAAILIPDGDVAAGIAAVLDNTDIDMCVGIGGSPEAVIVACAAKAMGGLMQVRIAPRDPAEASRARAAGLQEGKVYNETELVRGSQSLVALTGITHSMLLPGISSGRSALETSSLVIRSAQRAVRRVVTSHGLARG